jgi:PAS domain-containing protein
MKVSHFYNKWVSPQRWLERVGVRAPMQIVIGLVLLTSCVLQFARVAQLLPGDDEISLRHRTTVAEMASMEAASEVTHHDYAAARQLLNAMVQRYDDVLSAALRRRDGSIVAQTANHEKYWVGVRPGVNTPTHIQVLLSENQKPWGQLEISFAPLPSAASWTEWWFTSSVQMTAFILASVFLFFWLFLSRMLKVLDPSSAVPDRVQVLMDTLVEGLVIIDEKDRIVMANQSFANTVFSPVERLIGRTLSALPWLADEGEGTPELYPWKSVARSDLQQRGVPMRLQIGNRHVRRLTVNASPILDREGTHLGVIVTFADQTVVEAENLQMAHLVATFNKAGDDMGQLLAEVRSHANQGQLERLDNLAKVAVELAQLCQSVSKDQNSPATTADEVEQSGPSAPGIVS